MSKATIRNGSMVLLALIVVAFGVGCGSGPTESDKAATAAKFKQMNKNDVNHDATP